MTKIQITATVTAILLSLAIMACQTNTLPQSSPTPQTFQEWVGDKLAAARCKHPETIPMFRHPNPTPPFSAQFYCDYPAIRHLSKPDIPVPPPPPPTPTPTFQEWMANTSCVNPQATLTIRKANRTYPYSAQYACVLPTPTWQQWINHEMDTQSCAPGYKLAYSNPNPTPPYSATFQCLAPRTAQSPTNDADDLWNLVGSFLVIQGVKWFFTAVTGIPLP